MLLDTRDIVRKVRQIEIRSRKNSDASLQGQYHSAFKGQGMTFAEVRPYQFGDEIRRIDWNKTARFREPFVKVMEEERELTIMLLVDISASMNYGTRELFKKEYVAEIAASLGFSAAGNNDKVGLILFADKVYRVIPPQKGRKHVLSLISHILLEPPVAAASDYGTALQYLLNVFKKRSFIFILSDFNELPDQKMLKIAAAKHQLLALQITDEKESALPDVGLLSVTDAETGQTTWLSTSDKKMLHYYENYRAEHRQRVRQEFEQASAGFVQLRPGDNYTQPLMQLFKKH